MRDEISLTKVALKNPLIKKTGPTRLELATS